MWVRSLSQPPPHPLVLTGKGRSFLQPKLPTLPLRPFLLSVCFMFPILFKKVRVFAAFTADFCGGLLNFCLFLWSCAVFLGGKGTPLSFISCTGIVHWHLFFFSAVICMVLCISNLGYGHTRGSHYTVQYTLKQVLLLHSFCMNLPIT